MGAVCPSRRQHSTSSGSAFSPEGQSGSQEIGDRTTLPKDCEEGLELPVELTPQSERSEAEIQALRCLDAAYGGNAALSNDAASWEGYCMVEQVNGHDNTALYGELAPAALIEVFRYLNLQRGQHFLDLGSGTGKLVNLAAMLGFKSTGVELEPERFQSSTVTASRMFRRSKDCTLKVVDSDLIVQDLPKFVKSNMLDFDFSAADVVFAGSVTWTDEMMQALANTGRKMRPGSKIVSFKPFPGPEFSTIAVLQLQVSWRSQTGKGPGTAPFQVQEVVSC
eukprot:TRINITY_DN37035_c0_g1_i1.p1 TRINITY_DN37035_c0_g1~~TRINITY_DN37035_c0_g1_i1.p1  ORF type:complete len:279 (+),score=51.87 TRINITY_DN37035_c0_g1_i1:60-896(+)